MTLREQLSLVNFRQIEAQLTGMYHENTKTVRIYLDIGEWFEFGIYDFGYENERDKKVDMILTKKILDSEVTSIAHCDDLPMLEIWINYNKKSA